MTDATATATNFPTAAAYGPAEPGYNVARFVQLAARNLDFSKRAPSVRNNQLELSTFRVGGEVRVLVCAVAELADDVTAYAERVRGAFEGAGWTVQRDDIDDADEAMPAWLLLSIEAPR